jgi:hypothetical protein
MADYEKMLETMREHRANPEPGDYWHECFSPYFVVLAVGAHDVLVCKKIVHFPKEEKWTFDVQYTTTMSRAAFVRHLSYNTPGMADKSPAMCAPGKMVWAVEDWRNSTTIEHDYEE